MGADRVGRLCQHLVDQRCFYPVAPSPMDADGVRAATGAAAGLAEQAQCHPSERLVHATA